MRLCQEYFERNEISVPFIPYDGNADLLLRSRSIPYNWMSVKIRWKHFDTWHPGQFFFHIYNCKHNGYMNSSWFFENSESEKIYWDGYEKRVMDLVDCFKLGYVPVTGKELQVAPTLILLKTCDLLIADLVKRSILDSNVWNLVESVLDESATWDKRIEASGKLTTAFSKLTCPSSKAIRDGQVQIKAHMISSHWLASLFENENAPSHSG